MTRLVLSFAVFALFAGAALAQPPSYAERRAKLVSLAEVLGGAHSMGRLCAPETQSDVWRYRMMRLIELEQPSTQDRNAMVAAFNKGYRGVQTQFPECTEAARRESRRLAKRGEALVQDLSSMLYQLDEDDPDAPTVWRGSTPGR